MRYSTAIVLIAATLAGCSAPPKPTPPAIRPIATPTPTPRPSLVAPPLPASWNDWPFTPGDWVYRTDARGSIALFGAAGEDALLTVRCARSPAMIYVSVRGPANAATIRTTTLTRAIAMQPTGGDPAYVASALATTDNLLDAIAFSRGRFVVERAGQAPIVAPPYAEVGRVIEDCRG